MLWMQPQQRKRNNNIRKRIIKSQDIITSITTTITTTATTTTTTTIFCPSSPPLLAVIIIYYYFYLLLLSIVSSALLLPAGVESLTLTMGLLKVGKPKTFDNSKRDLSYIRNAGVRQFISTYNRVKDFKGDELLWGDEIEYGIFKIDPVDKKVRLSLRAKEIMDELNYKESEHAQIVEGCNWVPEYGAWMVEATPNRPYTGYTTDLLRVERNMRLRRKRILTVLHENEIAPTISAYPLLGAQGNDGSIPPTKVGGSKTLSEYIGDDIINPHPRFGTLTANIRQRRGSKVNIEVPLFRDVNTPEYENFGSPKPVAPTATGAAATSSSSKSADHDHGCCGSDSQHLWRYGKGDACYEQCGFGYVNVGCSRSPADEKYYDSQNYEKAVERGMALQKWLVDVQCPGCRGLFYRRAPHEIVPDADWPRNGDIVVGYELQEPSNWIRLQNGYYLPMNSENGKIQFLHKITNSVAQPSNTEMKRIGSNTPLFRSGDFDSSSNKDLASLVADESTKSSSVAAAPVVATTKPETTTTPETANATKTGGCGGGGGQHGHQPQSDETTRAAIHMDAMAFGMGCCCLQITFQAKDMDESRYIYDQLAVMAPIMMALTAATPILRGRLADTDCRWGIISESVDDRTLAERGRNDPNAPYPDLTANGTRRVYKSRYDSISTYIYQGTSAMTNEEDGNNLCGNLENRVLNMYNDIPAPVDGATYKLLRENGVDPALANHVAHLFIRDPLVVFDGAVEEVDDDTQTEHWESIQSTNWQTVRWKPPPPRNSPNDPHIGWRTEFRSMEIQLTDFENAAFTAFIVLLTRVILTFDLNLYLPLSKVDANMQRAHSRNAAMMGKFFFRRHMAPLEKGDDGYGVEYASMFSRAANGGGGDKQNDTGVTSPDLVSTASDVSNTTASSESGGGGMDVSTQRKLAPCAPGGSEENSYEEMSMAEIMCGKGDYYPGLIPLILAYLDHINCDSVTRTRLTAYLDFIGKRARGELVTPATWMRNFVRSHPSYKGDSVVSDEIAYDLMNACKDIGEGRLEVPELLGKIKIQPITPEGAYEVKLDSSRVQNDRLLGLLRRYTNRQSFGASSSPNPSLRFSAINKIDMDSFS